MEFVPRERGRSRTRFRGRPFIRGFRGRDRGGYDGPYGRGRGRARDYPSHADHRQHGDYEYYDGREYGRHSRSRSRSPSWKRAHARDMREEPTTSSRSAKRPLMDSDSDLNNPEYGLDQHVSRRIILDSDQTAGGKEDHRSSIADRLGPPVSSSSALFEDYRDVNRGREDHFQGSDRRRGYRSDERFQEEGYVRRSNEREGRHHFEKSGFLGSYRERGRGQTADYHSSRDHWSNNREKEKSDHQYKRKYDYRHRSQLQDNRDKSAYDQPQQRKDSYPERKHGSRSYSRSRSHSRSGSWHKNQSRSSSSSSSSSYSRSSSRSHGSERSRSPPLHSSHSHGSERSRSPHLQSSKSLGHMPPDPGLQRKAAMSGDGSVLLHHDPSGLQGFSPIKQDSSRTGVSPVCTSNASSTIPMKPDQIELPSFDSFSDGSQLMSTHMKPPSQEELMKPLKSILKNKNDPEASDMSSTPPQDAGFQSKILKLLGMLGSNPRDERRGQNMSTSGDIDDEEKYLYGESNESVEKSPLVPELTEGRPFWAASDMTSRHESVRDKQARSLFPISDPSRHSRDATLPEKSADFNEQIIELLLKQERLAETGGKSKLLCQKAQAYGSGDRSEVDMFQESPKMFRDGITPQQQLLPDKQSLMKADDIGYKRTDDQQASVGMAPDTRKEVLPSIRESKLVADISQNELQPVSMENEQGRGQENVEEIDNTIKNILQSIGFDFALSKRMQELAKKKKDAEQNPEFGIDHSASFIGGGLSSSDITDGLFEKQQKGPTAADDFLMKAKETADKSHSKYHIVPEMRDPKDSHIISKNAAGDFWSSRDDIAARNASAFSYLGETRHASLQSCPSKVSKCLADEEYEARLRAFEEKLQCGRAARVSRNEGSKVQRERDACGRQQSSRDRDSHEWDLRSRSKFERDDRFHNSPDHARILDSWEHDEHGRGSLERDSHSHDRSEQDSRNAKNLEVDQKRSLYRSKDFEHVCGREDRDRNHEARQSSAQKSWPSRGSGAPDQCSSSSHATQQMVPGRIIMSDNSSTETAAADIPSAHCASASKNQLKTPRSVMSSASKFATLSGEIVTDSKASHDVEMGHKRIVLLPKGTKKIGTNSRQESSHGEMLDKDKPKPSVTPEELLKLMADRKERQNKLELLEKEMDALKKQQNEIMRRRQRQKDGHKDPMLMENSRLQEEVAEQITALRMASLTNVMKLKEAKTLGILTGDSSSTSLTSSESISTCSPIPKSHPAQEEKIHYIFYDEGNNWCRLCNEVVGSLQSYLQHLQSKKHLGLMDPYDKPWLIEALNKDGDKKPVEGSLKSLPIKGAEFLMPAKAYYCSLCHNFSGDIMSADNHLKSDGHYEKYLSHLSKNPVYERRLTLERAALLSQFDEDKEQGRKRTRVETKEKLVKSEEITKKEKRDKMNAGVFDSAAATSVSPASQVPSLLTKELVSEVHQKVSARKDAEKVQSIKRKEMENEEAKKERVKRETTLALLKTQEEDKEREKEKESEANKGKIAIKLTGKTGIQNRPTVALPPWTPITKKIPAVKSKLVGPPPKKPKTEPPKQPVPLDLFLSISDHSKTVPLPIFKPQLETEKLSAPTEINDQIKSIPSATVQTEQMVDIVPSLDNIPLPSQPPLPMDSPPPVEETTKMAFGIDEFSIKPSSVSIPPAPLIQNSSLLNESGPVSAETTNGNEGSSEYLAGISCSLPRMPLQPEQTTDVAEGLAEENERIPTAAAALIASEGKSEVNSDLNVEMLEVSNVLEESEMSEMQASAVPESTDIDAKVPCSDALFGSCILTAQASNNSTCNTCERDEMPNPCTMESESAKAQNYSEMIEESIGSHTEKIFARCEKMLELDVAEKMPSAGTESARSIEHQVREGNKGRNQFPEAMPAVESSAIGTGMASGDVESAHSSQVPLDARNDLQKPSSEFASVMAAPYANPVELVDGNCPSSSEASSGPAGDLKSPSAACSSSLSVLKDESSSSKHASDHLELVDIQMKTSVYETPDFIPLSTISKVMQKTDEKAETVFNTDEDSNAKEELQPSSSTAVVQVTPNQITCGFSCEIPDPADKITVGEEEKRNSCDNKAQMSYVLVSAHESLNTSISVPAHDGSCREPSDLELLNLTHSQTQEILHLQAPAIGQPQVQDSSSTSADDIVDMSLSSILEKTESDSCLMGNEVTAEDQIMSHERTIKDVTKAETVNVEMEMSSQSVLQPEMDPKPRLEPEPEPKLEPEPEPAPKRVTRRSARLRKTN